VFLYRYDIPQQVKIWEPDFAHKKAAAAGALVVDAHPSTSGIPLMPGHCSSSVVKSQEKASDAKDWKTKWEMGIHPLNNPKKHDEKQKELLFGDVKAKLPKESPVPSLVSTTPTMKSLAAFVRDILPTAQKIDYQVPANIPMYVQNKNV
jgi:hypothetical protein